MERGINPKYSGNELPATSTEYLFRKQKVICFQLVISGSQNHLFSPTAEKGMECYKMGCLNAKHITFHPIMETSLFK
jgi:hypothetical protein